jgi:hypothetical protein
VRVNDTRTWRFGLLQKLPKLLRHRRMALASLRSGKLECEGIKSLVISSKMTLYEGDKLLRTRHQVPRSAKF